MSCRRMENKILPYVDGRVKESERLEMEKHLASCSACQLRVNEFRQVSGFLDELPQIEPSAAFDVRVRARGGGAEEAKLVGMVFAVAASGVCGNAVAAGDRVDRQAASRVWPAYGTGRSEYQREFARA